ncbi:hypothetical protein, variant [Verruconis gallopava]|uniref:Restriction of telomere capping protein 5 n=1 Tax=Verruconis gallopava TaxID=253628 RepID=A0A0D2ALF2_9PEZI|nr:uncharacterized protein PV09_02193 [Verruconis gallopava]XP_016217215.1 hypothetical protein, variant [Verruconis gallopava]KIW07345.1 hypothetical protein PV09_02193 [Verruconis gallopava]KIW07346.1 hypothetical protein, variant [Verruconis gallopava]
MGQGQSQHGPPPTIEELSAQLTQTFATKCYTPLELYCFKEVFKSLADHQSDIKYWSEGTLCRFLELPDALNVGAVIFQLASYLGAFPFPSQAPAILTNDALLRCVTVLTGRWAKVLKSGRGGRGKVLWRREVWRGCAVFDRIMSPTVEGTMSKEPEPSQGAAQGFAVDRAVDDEEEDEEDGLAFEAFEMMDVSETYGLTDKSTMQHAMIPSDNFLRLIQLLLVAAPLAPQESLAKYSAAQLEEDKLARLRETAGNMLASFGGVEQSPGVRYKTFERVLAATMPFLLDSIQPLFEHFLFPKDLDMHKRKKSLSNPSALRPEIPKEPSIPEPLLPKEGDILDLPMLHQLASFLGGSALYRRLQPLYSGNVHGFSMGQFEKSCFKWLAPSILLVSGTLLSPNAHNSREREFLESVPYKRFSPSTTGKRLVYGAYIPVPWKTSPKAAFGTADTKLFQLSPIHDVFSANTLEKSYIYFTKSPSARTGVGFGSPLPSQSMTSSHYSADMSLPLGPVSLHIDDTLTYCSFTHSSQGGGAFHTSTLPQRKGADWQDRFEIEALEVWGCGGTEEAEQQRKAWAWEEKEAEARRRINLGTGDIEADRELLRMAGLIGGGGRDSGGSMA